MKSTEWFTKKQLDYISRMNTSVELNKYYWYNQNSKKNLTTSNKSIECNYINS